MKECIQCKKELIGLTTNWTYPNMEEIFGRDIFVIDDDKDQHFCNQDCYDLYYPKDKRLITISIKEYEELKGK